MEKNTLLLCLLFLTESLVLTLTVQGANCGAECPGGGIVWCSGYSCSALDYYGCHAFDQYGNRTYSRFCQPVEPE